MNRLALVAVLTLLAGSLPAMAAPNEPLWETSPTKPAGVLPPLPLPPAQHADVPPLPPGDSGYVRDPRTGQYTAENGRAIWVPAHTENGRQVEGQWMYQKPATEAYGR
jgi:hypothetical protein